MKLTRRLFGVLSGAALALGTVPLTAQGLAAQEASTLVIAVPSDPAGLEPGINKAEPIGSEIILNVFDTLVAWKAPEFSELEGRLATGWTVSEDGKTFDFTLRDGVTFHDGTPFNAEAVKFSIERTAGMNPYVEATLGLIESIETPSETEVVFILSRPYPAFLSILAQPQSAIVSPAAVEKFGDDFATNPVGTGPFKFRAYQADTRVVLDANADYFRGAPKLERLIYTIIPEASTRRLELENGGVDIIQQAGQLSAVPSEEMAAFAGNPEIQILESPSQIIRQLEFNNSLTEGPFTDVRVRRAIAMAIDNDGLLSGVFDGTAERVYGPLTSNSWAFDPAVKDLAPKYDPEGAKALLEEAGVDPADLSVKLYSFQGALWGAVATFVQANLAEIGVDVEIAQTEFPSYRALHVAGEWQMALDGRQPWYNDPDAHVTIGYLSSLKDSAMTFRMPENAELDAKILEAQGEADMDTRKALYSEIQKEIVEEVPGAYLFSPKLIVFARSNVDGLVVNSAPPLNEYWSVSKN
ncbi:ABC transporter substrate-binding protein [Yangia mangrovi]|uniref:ABC transporter substrate-binding protein n=1 Tax=Alloyangia mangrovi TaxID=1779329 RepID=A0A2A3JPG1_9RHOB|nr:ABC transporter substrate-binding protein [Alloyangia mangrovi]MCT4372746.1 ABC transporter substrate-binding protein [Alloyangia mangrovi]